MGDMDEEGCDVCMFYHCRCGQRIYPNVNPAAITPDVWLDMEDGWDVYYVQANFNRDVELIEVEWDGCVVCNGSGQVVHLTGPATCEFCRGEGVVL